MEDKGKILYLVKLLERSLIEKLVENDNEVKALIENDPRYFSIPSQKKFDLTDLKFNEIN